MANNSLINNDAANIQGSLLELNTIPKSDKNILDIRQQAGQNTIRQIWNLRQMVYSTMFPAIKTFAHDPYDSKACVLYTCNKMGNVSSTARIAFDTVELGIPEKELLPNLISQLRQEKSVFAELGRFVIDKQARGSLQNYFRAFYDIAMTANIDTYVFLIRQQSIPFFTRLLNANVNDLLDETFGGQSAYAVLRWDLNNTPARFFSWSGTSVPYKALAEVSQ